MFQCRIKFADVILTDFVRSGYTQFRADVEQLVLRAVQNFPHVIGNLKRHDYAEVRIQFIDLAQRRDAQ